MKTYIAIIILTILHTTGGSANIDETGNTLFDKEQMWNEAFNACQKNNTRLATVQLHGQTIKLEEGIDVGSDTCFWVGAIYEYNKQDTGCEFLIDFCESVSIIGDTYQYMWQSCGAYCQFLCASDDKTVSANTATHEFVPWCQASKKCHDQNVSLPSKNNSAYINYIPRASSCWWLNSTKHLNLSPSNAKYGDRPICLCRQEFRDIQCPADTKTLCFPYDSRLHIRATSSIPKSEQPLETSHSTPTVIVTSIIADNSPLIGGVTGAAVFLIAFVIVTIIIIKMIRKKQRAEDDMKLKTLDAKQTKNNLTIFEANYNVDAILTSFPDSQTFQSESESYKQGKLNAISINKNDDKNITISNDTPLYSQVQKSQGKKFDAEENDKCFGSNNKYDAINFEKESAGETSGNVYDKADFHNRDHNGEIHENLYDKAGYSFNGLGHNGRTIYDNNHYDTTTLSDTVTEQTYDHV